MRLLAAGYIGGWTTAGMSMSMSETTAGSPVERRTAAGGQPLVGGTVMWRERGTEGWKEESKAAETD